MGPLGFRRHPFTEGSHVPAPLDPRPGRTGRADLPVPPPGRRRRPPRSSPTSSPPNPITNSWGRPSSRSATASTRSAPRPSRPLWTSGKKGVPRLQHELPALPRVGPVRRYRPKTVQVWWGLSPWSGPITTAVVWHGHGPLGRALGLSRQALTPGARETGLHRRRRGQLRRGRRRGAQQAGPPARLGGRCTGWTTRVTWRRVGRSAWARWKRRARRSLASG